MEVTPTVDNLPIITYDKGGDTDYEISKDNDDRIKGYDTDN